MTKIKIRQQLLELFLNMSYILGYDFLVILETAENCIELLTLVLLNCFNCIFRHLKLELLTQFPASNDEKYYYLWKIDMCKIKLLDQLSVY